MNTEYSIYPLVISRSRPFYIEITENESKNKYFQLFKAYYFDEEHVEQAKKELLYFSETGHPWNLGFEGEFASPNVVSLWTESYVKFMVDALNDRHERLICPLVKNAEPA